METGFNLGGYREELEEELANILDYWMAFTPDKENGGFIGRINNDNVPDAHAPKGAVMHARILWSFSAAYPIAGKEEYLSYANRAWRYLKDRFLDEEFGGVYWTLDYTGQPLDTKKQVYAIAFVIYALAEYYKISALDEVKLVAIGLYRDLVRHAFDEVKGGYFEAFTRDWKDIADLRLSEKDANERKSMNTHLHVLEAYTNLFRIWPDEELNRQILQLLRNFREYIIDGAAHHLILFQDEQWNPKSRTISFGHDIEAAWLLLEAAEVIGNAEQVADFKQISLDMATASREGLDQNGGMFYELEPCTGHMVREKHWWAQAEAMVGFFNAWQISADVSFLRDSLAAWEFVKRCILDKKNGEWFWGIDEHGHVMEQEDKAGIWKCPYHNSRACLEVMRRIGIGLS